MKDRYKYKHLDFRKAIWKVVDDYSGAYTYSNKVTFDFRGYMTIKGHENIEPPAEHPPQIHEDNQYFERLRHTDK